MRDPRDFFRVHFYLDYLNEKLPNFDVKYDTLYNSKQINQFFINKKTENFNLWRYLIWQCQRYYRDNNKFLRDNKNPEVPRKIQASWLFGQKAIFEFRTSPKWKLKPLRRWCRVNGIDYEYDLEYIPTSPDIIKYGDELTRFYHHLNNRGFVFCRDEGVMYDKGSRYCWCCKTLGICKKLV